MRDIAAEQGFHYLPGSPLIAGEVGFAGSLGWYDYSLRDRRLDGVIEAGQYERGIFPDGVWNDIRNAVWLRDPKSEDWRQRRLRLTTCESFSRVVAMLKQDLEQIAKRVGKIVAVIHTIPSGLASDRATNRIPSMPTKAAQSWENWSPDSRQATQSCASAVTGINRSISQKQAFG